MSFQLLDTFKKKIKICDLKLSTVILESKEFPWILLIPRVENANQINHLSIEDQLQLTREINLCSCIMEELFECDRLNVAAIGNKTPQLHVHIICRSEKDPLWPETIWGKPMNNISFEEAENRASLIRNKIEIMLNDY